MGKNVRILVVLLLLALGTGAMWRLTRKPSEPIRISLSPWIGYDTIWVAQELGITAEEGVDVRTLDQVESSGARRAYEKGQVDAFGETLMGLLVANDGPAGEGSAIGVAVLDISNGADMLLARAEFNRVEDLRGRRVAMESGSPDVLLTMAALRAHGMKLEDVVVVNKLQSQLKAAFLAGEVDAACSYPPYSDQLADAVGTKVLFTSVETPGMIVDLLIVREQVVATRRSELQALVRANNRVVKMMLDGDEKVIGMIAKREGEPPEAIRRYAKGLRFPSPREQAEMLAAGGVVDSSLKVSRAALEASKVLTLSSGGKELLSTVIVEPSGKD